jgi:hypothetical protein
MPEDTFPIARFRSWRILATGCFGLLALCKLISRILAHNHETVRFAFDTEHPEWKLSAFPSGFIRTSHFVITRSKSSIAYCIQVKVDSAIPDFLL